MGRGLWVITASVAIVTPVLVVVASAPARTCQSSFPCVIAGVVLILILLVAFVFLWRQRARAKENTLKLTARMTGLEETEVTVCLSVCLSVYLSIQRACTKENTLKLTARMTGLEETEISFCPSVCLSVVVSFCYSVSTSPSVIHFPCLSVCLWTSTS